MHKIFQTKRKTVAGIYLATVVLMGPERFELSTKGL